MSSFKNRIQNSFPSHAEWNILCIRIKSLSYVIWMISLTGNHWRFWRMPRQWRRIWWLSHPSCLALGRQMKRCCRPWRVSTGPTYSIMCRTRSAELASSHSSWLLFCDCCIAINQTYWHESDLPLKVHYGAPVTYLSLYRCHLRNTVCTIIGMKHGWLSNSILYLAS